MSWQAPRTDWRQADAYLAEDDGRIRGNAAHLRGWANRVCAPMDRTPLGSYTSEDVLTVSAYNAVEAALAAVAGQVGPAGYTRRTLAPGSPVWDDGDLRRLEGLSAELYRRLQAAEKNRPLLDFVLGGEGWDAQL